MNPFRRFFERFKTMWQPIPPGFDSFEHGEPFRLCSVCSCDLNDSRWGYLIQKSYIADRLIFECAICTSCCKAFGQEMSRPSKKAVRKFVRRNRQVKGVLDQCHFCLLPVRELTEYSQIIDCMDGEMLVWQHPLVFCGDCETDLYNCLSKSTRDDHDRWMDENFGLPPGVEIDLPDGTKVPRKPMLI